MKLTARFLHPHLSSQQHGPAWLALMLVLMLLGACDSKADFSYSDGNTGNYADFSGQWLVINYWADWCKPCIKEIPELNRFAADNSKVRVIGVNYDIMAIEKEQAIIKKLDIHFPVIRTHIHEHYGYKMPVSLPTTVIISPEGEVKKVLLGPQTLATLIQAVSN